MIKIIFTTREAGYYTWEFDNGHRKTIEERPELREWHLFGYDENGNNYEPVHPFYDSLREAKQNLDRAISNIKNH